MKDVPFSYKNVEGIINHYGKHFDKIKMHL
jgi:hypothetical protein